MDGDGMETAGILYCYHYYYFLVWRLLLHFLGAWSFCMEEGLE